MKLMTWKLDLEHSSTSTTNTCQGRASAPADSSPRRLRLSPRIGRHLVARIGIGSAVCLPWESILDNFFSYLLYLAFYELRYNSRTVKWVMLFLHIQSCANRPQDLTSEHFYHPPKETLYSLEVTRHPFSPPAQGNHQSTYTLWSPRSEHFN